MNRIEKTRAYLDALFNNSEHLKTSLYDKSYRYEHTLRVASWGKRIAQHENINEEALVIGCLLHDVAYIEKLDTKEKQIGHGRRSASIVRDFVHGLGFDPDTTQSILYGIATHVDGKADFEGESTILSESISDADNLDRFDVYRIYETLIFADFSNLSLEDKLTYCTKRIEATQNNMAHELATHYATSIFREELSYMQTFFEKMLIQLKESR
ncbi:hypothetical protein AOC36_03675 [Erysipelothrix larvae]|uniref:HD domain-containing protein n=1 Tax=Erysipelothrix larvae TaxID=1514105 RepID=A0A120JTJ7_9FIRM|nr:HD domain-containing protein [Erysipelothrix larvae]AMC93107.1 hypothetical protein AOC36_03675 [Erysipelothrix larvae]